MSRTIMLIPAEPGIGLTSVSLGVFRAMERKSKAPNSPVSGRATVFIFPDLNTGNTTYKAVQRTAELSSIGSILQGMRGAQVDDIVYTIALTGIQASF